MRKQILSIIVILFLLSGCATAKSMPTPASGQLNQDAPAAVQVNTAVPTSVTIPVATSISTPTIMSPQPGRQADKCNNPYFPVVNGATWLYETTGIGQATHTLSTTEKGQFTITVKNNDSTFLLEGQCTEDGIILVDNGMSAIYQGSEGGSTLTTQSQEGVSLPNDIQQGDDWSQTIQMTSSNAEQPITATIVSDYKAEGYESVTIPAGTFEALKIIQSSTITMNGMKLMTSNSTLWYVEGVGNVKAEEQAGGSEASVVQLISYNIP
jgi:hypothetical protein